VQLPAKISRETKSNFIIVAGTDEDEYLYIQNKHQTKFTWMYGERGVQADIFPVVVHGKNVAESQDMLQSIYTFTTIEPRHEEYLHIYRPPTR
jgi:hypothetical protein